MKQGNSVITLVMILLAAALTAYLGFYAWNTFNVSYTTTVAYAYTNNDSVEADGLLVRQEQVLPSHSGIVDLARSEGEKVAAGKTVALVYRDGAAQSAQNQQEELTRDIEVLEYAIQSGGDVSSTARLDENILQSLVSLRSATALDNYSRLEDQVIQLKSAVLKRDLTYGTGITSSDLTAHLQALKLQLSDLKQQSGSATTRIVAPVSGVFSAQTDGCEDMTPQQLLTMDHRQLSELIVSASPTPQSGGSGKLITSDRWYLAVPLSPETGLRFEHLSSILVRFTGDFTQDVTMKVDRVVSDETGAAAILSSDEYLSSTTLLRRQTVELIFDSSYGIRVPKACLRMESEEVTDPDSSQTETVNHLGVYAIVNGRAVFKEAEVISEGADFYVLRSVTTGKNALRAGDELVLRGAGVFNGKLMEY